MANEFYPIDYTIEIPEDAAKEIRKVIKVGTIDECYPTTFSSGTHEFTNEMTQYTKFKVVGNEIQVNPNLDINDNGQVTVTTSASKPDETISYNTYTTVNVKIDPSKYFDDSNMAIGCNYNNVTHNIEYSASTTSKVNDIATGSAYVAHAQGTKTISELIPTGTLSDRQDIADVLGLDLLENYNTTIQDTSAELEGDTIHVQCKLYNTHTSTTSTQTYDVTVGQIAELFKANGKLIVTPEMTIIKFTGVNTTDHQTIAHGTFAIGTNSTDLASATIMGQVISSDKGAKQESATAITVDVTNAKYLYAVILNGSGIKVDNVQYSANASNIVEVNVVDKNSITITKGGTKPITALVLSDYKLI